MSISSYKKYNICLLSDQLAVGGAERCAANLSIFFENNDCRVTHIVVVDKIEYEHKGEIFNLGKLKNKSNSIFNKVKRLLALNKFLNENNFDFIIDFRFKRFDIQEFILARFIFNTKLIVTIHNFVLEWYFPKYDLLAKLIYKKGKIITVSDMINEQIVSKYNYKGVETIYNPVNFETITAMKDEIIPINDDFIIAVGRLQSVKQLNVLIEAYSKSVLIEKNVKLIILGEGEEKSNLEALIHTLKLNDNVFLLGFQRNPYAYIKRARYLVLTSKNEGFPMVLIESLACETPVISFDLPSGPSEIIKHKENGLLVENQNMDLLIKAINDFYLDDNLYKSCKKNAIKSIEKFTFEQIGVKWLDLFNRMIKR